MYANDTSDKKKQIDSPKILVVNANPVARLGLRTLLGDASVLIDASNCADAVGILSHEIITTAIIEMEIPDDFPQPGRHRLLETMAEYGPKIPIVSLGTICPPHYRDKYPIRLHYPHPHIPGLDQIRAEILALVRGEALRPPVVDTSNPGPPTVLLVDDDVMVQEYFDEDAARLVSVDTIKLGLAAMATVRPDLVLVDLFFKTPSGAQSLLKGADLLRATSESNTPCAIYSGCLDINEAEKLSRQFQVRLYVKNGLTSAACVLRDFAAGKIRPPVIPPDTD